MDEYLLGVKIGQETVGQILNKVASFLVEKPDRFYHIVNLNPDIFVLAYQDYQFRQIVDQADSILIDGIGVKLAAKLFGKKSGERLTGTDLMKLLVEFAADHNKRVMFLGGKKATAQRTAQRFKGLYPNLQCCSSPGALSINKETDKERKEVLEIIKTFRPHFLFVAYGPPYQERWIYKHRHYLKGVVCMGVGGGFNFISGQVHRAPKLVTMIGFEWLWRFIFEPYRWRKLPRYLYFVSLILINYPVRLLKIK